MQVHLSTGLTLLDLVHARHPANPIIDPPRSVLSSNRPNRTARAVKDELVNLLEKMFVRASEKLAKEKSRYKRDHDKRVRTILYVHSGDNFFLGNPPGIAHADANRANKSVQSKLNSPASGTHEVIRSTDTTVTISVDGVHGTVSLDRIALVPRDSASPTIATADNPPELAPTARQSDSARDSNVPTSPKSSYAHHST